MRSKKIPVFDESIAVSHKRVVVRVDFNVPAQEKQITDDFRIQKTAPLLHDLQSRGARIVLLSHLTEKKEHRSFEHLVPAFERVCGMHITFAKTIQEACTSSDDVVLLENLRVFPGEEINELSFAKELAGLGDIYVNEDFSQSHRPYASMVSLPALLPSYAGPLFCAEVEKLEEMLEPSSPFTLVLGGVKFKTKVGVLEHFINRAEAVFVGGALANTFLVAAGYSVGSSIVEEEAVPVVREKFIASKRLFLPSDVRVDGGIVRAISDIKAHDVIRDAGPETSRLLREKAAQMRMILWNGPLGHIEKGYRTATVDFLQSLAGSTARVVIGGGDTIAVLRKEGLEHAFWHVSTGGGAMLEFLATGTLPGIKALM